MAISISGFNGLDTDTLVRQLMYLEEAPLRRLEQSKQDIQTRIKAWQDLNSALDTFKNRAQDLSDIFDKMAPTVDNDEVLTVSATNLALAGQYEITVEQLFQAHTVAFSARIDAEEISGQFKIAINGFEVEIDVKDANIYEIAEMINKAVAEDGDKEIQLAKASVVDNKLVIQAAEDVIDIAKDNTLSFVNIEGDVLSALKLDEPGVLHNHQNARFTVNGLTVERGKNEGIDDVIKGVTLNLKGKTGEKATVKIGTDTALMKDKIKAFVDQYNKLVDAINKYGKAGQAQIDSGSGPAVLSGDATLRSIESMLYNSVMTPSRSISSTGWLSNNPLSWEGEEKTLVVDGVSITLNGTETLKDIADKINNTVGVNAKSRVQDNRLVFESKGSQPVDLSGSDNVVLRDLQLPATFKNNVVSLLGIEIDRYGKLSIDDEKLDEALASNLSDVKQLFTGVGGIIDRVESNVDLAIKSYSSSGGGYISSRIKTLQAEIRYIDEDIENMERRLEMRESRLRAQFSQMDSILSQLNNQSTWLMAQFSNLYNN
ncbi:MAG TPA: flagellar filament capping protein FliD [Halanaerobiales bacterium]|nr:flagellar filament capping protein FliD [Halanaerobiales bacterium]HPZ63401.1 flagellar filament capping protein FliD [Halanaerobiales bacterium]HQD04612.1 flagellar filament capping protein FliD [Halanaerobiales bacterium]